METISKSLGSAYATIVALVDSITAVKHLTVGRLNWVTDRNLLSKRMT